MAKHLNSIQPVVLRHAAWLVVNNVQGCPKDCAYCFLKPINQTGTVPSEVLNAKDSISMLKTHELYHADSPVCFYTSTDPFATPYVEEKLVEVLEEFLSQGLRNTVCFVTKCCPKGMLDKTLKKFKDKKIPVVAYISYSGLTKEIEKGVKQQDILDSFVYFHERDIPIIHYWRPFLPQNTDIETMEKVVSYASQYAYAAVVTGLKLYTSMQDQLLFWPEVREDIQKAADSECVWPREALEKSTLLSQKYDYPVFQTNSCALSYVLKQHNPDAMWQTPVCRSYNTCPTHQRDKCNNFYSNHSLTEEVVLETLKMLKKNVDDCQIKILEQSPPIVEISGVMLDTSAISSLREILHAVVVSDFHRGHYWGSSVTQEEPYTV